MRSAQTGRWVGARRNPYGAPGNAWDGGRQPERFKIRRQSFEGGIEFGEGAHLIKNT